MSGYPGWGMWIVMILGTAAFWAVVFLAVRVLYIGQDTSTSSSPTPAGSVDGEGSRQADRLQERLARGEITVAEYEDLSTETANLAGPPPARPPHH